MFMLSFTDPVIVLSMFMLSFIVPTIVLSMFMLSFTDPAIVLSMFMLSFFFVIVCGLLSGNESVIVGINPIIRGDSWDPNKASYIFNT
jgi:hypothetical protein